MVAELAVVVLTGIDQLYGGLQQAPLGLALPGAAPNRLGMMREHGPDRIGVLVRQGLERPLQDRAFLTRKGVACAEGWELATEGGEVQLAFNGRSPVEIRRLRAAIIAEPLTEVFDQRTCRLWSPGDMGQGLGQGDGEVKGKFTE